MTTGIGIIIGVLIGVAGPFLARFIWNWHMQPVLVIGEDVPQEGERLVRHSISIFNRGRTAAKNSNVLLTINGIVKDDVIDDLSRRPSYVTSDAYRPINDMSLCWSFQIYDPIAQPINPAFLSIYPNSKGRVELCKVHRDSLEIEVPSEMGWQIRRVIMRGNKEYDIELKIFAENVRYDPKKHVKKFKLIPSSEKKGIIVEPLDR